MHVKPTNLNSKSLHKETAIVRRHESKSLRSENEIQGLKVPHRPSY